MRTIGQILSSTPSYRTVEVPELPNVGGIGIELELESTRPFRDVRGWVRTSDGSLRDGVEYVFDGPQAGRQALETIMAMGEELRASPPDPSFRCSTHIHMDVRDLGFDELDRLVALYTMFEGVMFDHCAPYRKYSNFCPPYFINDQQVRNFNQLFRRPSSPSSKLTNLRASWNKYSSLNLKVTGEIGSVEFRGSHALTTTEELLGLAQRMLHLKRYVKENQADDCMAFIQRARTVDLRDIFQQGLATNYSPDRETQDLCYSNAVFLAASAWEYDENRSTVQDAIDAVSPSAREREAWTTINEETFRLYNIDPSILSTHPASREHKALRAVLEVYVALQSVRGVQPPSFNSLLPEGRTIDNLVREYGATTVTTIFNSVGIRLTGESFRRFMAGTENI